MKPRPDQTKEIVLGVVEGTRDWRELHEIGLVITIRPGGVEVFAPSSIPAVTVAPTNLADGLRRQTTGGDASLWAQLILGMSSVLGLDSLQEDSLGEDLLEMLWDTAFGSPPSPRRIEHIWEKAHGHE